MAANRLSAMKQEGLFTLSHVTYGAYLLATSSLKGLSKNRVPINLAPGFEINSSNSFTSSHLVIVKL